MKSTFTSNSKSNKKNSQNSKSTIKPPDPNRQKKKQKQYHAQKICTTAIGLKLINLIDGSMKSAMKMNLCHFSPTNQNSINPILNQITQSTKKNQL